MFSDKDLQARNREALQRLFIDNVRVGSLIECRDEKEWRSAKVTQLKDNMLLVHYWGWEERYDKWMDKNSGKMRP